MLFTNKIPGITIVFLFIVLFANGQEAWLTHYEKSNFKETPRYDATIAYAKKLASASLYLDYSSFGKSPQGRDLPLLIFDKNQNFDIKAVKESGNLVLFIQACIHAGESNGKDAGLMLLRDIVIHHKYLDKLNDITIVFIPIFNVDGHERFGPYNRINQNGPSEMGWRTNAQRLNLNRDFMKADSPEMRAWLKLFNEWLPDFFIDIHSTDGADYQYPLTYEANFFSPGLGPEQIDWFKDKYIGPITELMENDKYPIFPYVSFRSWTDPTSGIRKRVPEPKLAHGYVMLHSRPALLVETHMLKDYKTRVSSTYRLLTHTLRLLAKEKRELLIMNSEQDIFTSINSPTDSFTLRHTTLDTAREIDFKGIGFEQETSDITGGTWFKYNQGPQDLKMKIYDQIIDDVKVKLPLAYIIPPEWTEVIELLSLHGVEISYLENDIDEIEVGTYQFSQVQFGRQPFEGRLRCNYEVSDTSLLMSFPKGSALVKMDQRTAKVVANLLEPQGPDALVHWGFFNTIFEQKEYAEPYVMEKKAREMIKNDPSLLEEYNKAKEANPQAFQNPWASINWFYARSEYWDDRINMYPVGRILDLSLIEGF